MRIQSHMLYTKMGSLCLKAQAAAREKKLLQSQGCPSRILETRLLRLGQMHVSNLSDAASIQTLQSVWEKVSS